MARGLVAGEVCRGWEYFEGVELLGELLEGGRSHGGWQQKTNVDAGRRFGRRSCSISCYRTGAGKGMAAGGDCRWWENIGAEEQVGGLARGL